jgi:hypothetical protein
MHEEKGFVLSFETTAQWGPKVKTDEVHWPVIHKEGQQKMCNNCFVEIRRKPMSRSRAKVIQDCDRRNYKDDEIAP